MGNTHIVEFLDEARKARKNAASGAQSQHLEAATGSSAVEGTAALVKAAARAKEQLLKRRREGEDGALVGFNEEGEVLGQDERIELGLICCFHLSK